MIQLRIKNYKQEELETLEKALISALISLPCELNEEGKCKQKGCKNYKVCKDLFDAHNFLCTDLNLPF